MRNGSKSGLYECVECESTKSVNGGVRKLSPCQTCNEITTWERIGNYPKEWDMIEIETLLEELDTVAMSTRDGVDGMHIPSESDDGPICGTTLTAGEWRYPHPDDVRQTNSWCSQCRRQALRRELFD